MPSRLVITTTRPSQRPGIGELPARRRRCEPLARAGAACRLCEVVELAVAWRILRKRRGSGASLVLMKSFGTIAPLAGPGDMLVVGSPSRTRRCRRRDSRWRLERQPCSNQKHDRSVDGSTARNRSTRVLRRRRTRFTSSRGPGGRTDPADAARPTRTSDRGSVADATADERRDRPAVGEEDRRNTAQLVCIPADCAAG